MSIVLSLGSSRKILSIAPRCLWVMFALSQLPDIRTASIEAVRLACLVITQHASVALISQHVNQHPPLGLRRSSGGQPDQVCVIQCTYHVSGDRLKQI